VTSAESTYRVLGSLEVGGAPDPVPITPGRQQVVLATLLLEANRVVGIDQLIDAIWYDDPPATARTQVQICVSGLRAKLVGLGPDGGPAIATRSPGYVLHLGADQLDASRFTRLVAESEALTRDGRHTDAARVLAEALALWRGPALSGTPSRVLQSRAAQLDEKRLSATEAHAELQLRLGRHHEVITDLGTPVGQNPLRERLRGQYMLALYRSGRQAEALEVYRVGRELLIDQLGLEPGEELRSLEAAILARDPALQPDEQPAPAHLPEPDVGPYQLPADIADFTAREDLIESAERMLLADGARSGRRAVRVMVMAGKPGVGKSALAVHLSHRLRESCFPDGQLYTDLGGTRAEPADPADVLGRFLRALGIPGAALPEALDERAEMFRSLLAHKRMLVLLDDAASEAQVRMLLPGSGASMVIVTSRARLTGLAGARVFEVDVMDAEQSLDLLGMVVGEQRVAAEPAAAGALIRLVGGLPLALRIVAARLAARPRWSLAWMVERLADERRRLDELAHGEMVVRASLALSYDGLEPEARRLLRLLSGFEAGSFPTWMAAAVLEADFFDAGDLLELLVDVQLLEIVAVDLNGSPRYKFHDIIRLFAREQLELIEPEDRRRDALGRVAGGWLAIAEQAHRRVYGGDYTVLHGSAPRWQPPASYVESVLGDPLAWLEAERGNLCAMVGQAADAGLDEACWDLAVSMVTLFESRCYFEDWEHTHQRALGAVRSAGNERGEAALTCSLASLHLTRSRPGAEELLQPALEAFTRLGDAQGRALARRNLGMLHLAEGDGERAAARFSEALADFRADGDPIGQAHVLSRLAQLDWDSGERDTAVRKLYEALGMCQGMGARRVEVQVRYRLSGLMVRRGDHRQALELLTDLLDVVRAGRDVVGEGRILHRLGTTRARLGQWEEAVGLLEEAVIARDLVLDHAGADEVRGELADARHALAEVVVVEQGAPDARWAGQPAGAARLSDPSRYPTACQAAGPPRC
jgi:DNA-binding SARP family transcriptional activator